MQYIGLCLKPGFHLHMWLVSADLQILYIDNAPSAIHKEMHFFTEG